MDTVSRLIGAIFIAFLAMMLVKSQRRVLVWWMLRIAISVPLFAAALWLVFAATPYPRDPGMPTVSIVASAVLIAGLAAEELIGDDVRRLFGI